MRILKIHSKDFKEIEAIGNSVLPIYYTMFDLHQMIRNNKFLLFKIVSGVKIVGFIILEKEAKNFHICSFGIVKEYQRQGIATGVLDRIKKKYNDCSLSLNVHVENTKAISCYEKNGFQKKKFLSKYYCVFTSCNDAYYMVCSQK